MEVIIVRCIIYILEKTLRHKIKLFQPSWMAEDGVLCIAMDQAYKPSPLAFHIHMACLPMDIRIDKCIYNIEGTESGKQNSSMPEVIKVPCPYG